MSAQNGAWRPAVSSGFVGQPPGFLWMFASTSWLALFFVPGGFGAWLAFLIIGLVVMRVSWLVSAGIYLVVAILIVTVWTSDAEPVVRAGMGAALQSIGFVHGIIAARTWLRILWGRRERGERLVGRPGRAAVGGAMRAGQRFVSAPMDTVPEEAEQLFAQHGTQQGDYFAVPAGAAGAGGADASAEASAAASASAGAAAGAAADAQSATPIDVNLATEKELADLPAMTPSRITRALELRAAEPFASAQQFADALGLQAHEFARIRALIIAHPPRNPRPARRIRRLDV